jgi:mono/diheme cytochrome c family protein
MRRVLLFCFVYFGFTVSPVLAGGEPPEAEPVTADHAEKMARGLALFKTDVRAILARRCVRCHGGEETRAGLDVTSRARLLRGGESGPGVVVGRHDESLVYELISHGKRPYMPHKEEKLPPQQIETVARWIDLGAPYDRPLSGKAARETNERAVTDDERNFWAFRPLSVARPPPVEDTSWVRHPLDRFVLARLEQSGLTPNPSADRRVLVRRLYLDLLGLPPSPAEVNAFLADVSPDSYDRLVDRLLASPRYGERWGRHWLDVARFAESHGFEHDHLRPWAYHYRDFVIQALNADMPYDQFVRWQVAGDEIAPDEPLALMATGFLGAGVFPTSITKREVESSRYDALDDMLSTTTNAFLGLTVGCARCHDHKFDPIPTRDYYRMLSTFTTTVRSLIDVDLDPEAYAKEKAAWDVEHAPLRQALKGYRNETGEPRFRRWLAAGAPEAPLEPVWQTLDLVNYKSKSEATLEKLPDGSILATGENPYSSEDFTLTGETPLRGITAFRLEALTHRTLEDGGPGRSPDGNFVLSDLFLRVEPLDSDGAEPVVWKLAGARASHEENRRRYSVKASFDKDPLSGWSLGGATGNSQAAVFELAEPVDFEDGVRLTFELRFRDILLPSMGRVRVSVTTTPVPVALDGSHAHQRLVEGVGFVRGGNVDALDDRYLERLRGWFARNMDAEWRRLLDAAEEHREKQPHPYVVKMQVTSEGLKPVRHGTQGADFFDETFFLERGDVHQKKQSVSQGFLQVLTRAGRKSDHWRVAPPEGWRTSYRRRSLARWLTDVSHGGGGLAARVIVNRLWQHHFGRGLVATANDFGFQGERPTDPELLDWLAQRLLRDGWRLKLLHKRIVTSAAYRQSSDYDAADASIDPQNVHGWRFRRRRMEAEVIRDALLAVSGALDTRMYGKGTLDSSMKRRSVYFQIKRSQIVPVLQTFDYPEPLVSNGRRASTTVAPQALVFMNDPLVRGCATELARRLLPIAQQSLDVAIDDAYRRVVTREATPEERADARAFVEAQLERNRASHPVENLALESTLTDFVQVLMGLNEFVYVF